MYTDTINSFNPDSFPNPVVGVASTITDYNSGWHQHLKHQLLFAKDKGVMVDVEQSRFFVPSNCAILIPAHNKHRTTAQSEIELRAVLFDNQQSLPDGVMLLTLTPLLREIVDKIAHWPWDKPFIEQYSIFTVFEEELKQALKQPLQLYLPEDRRLTPLLALIQENQIPPKLSCVEKIVGASSKTIGRIFLRETGLSYQAWRQQWRLMKAMEMLTNKHPVNYIAQQLEFSSSSAFIAFFQKHTSQTPGRFVCV